MHANRRIDHDLAETNFDVDLLICPCVRNMARVCLYVCNRATGVKRLSGGPGPFAVRDSACVRESRSVAATRGGPVPFAVRDSACARDCRTVAATRGAHRALPGRTGSPDPGSVYLPGPDRRSGPMDAAAYRAPG